MSPHERIPQGIDTERPSAARIYDYYLGGGNNFASDRALAKRVLATTPEIRTAALANREFLQRAVRYCVDRGVRQFLDIGSGIPTVGNTHEIAQKLDPECRVVYVDNEPVAVAHSELLLADTPNTAVVRKDLRDVHGVLRAEPARRLLNPDEPIAILMFAVLHFIPDSDEPTALLARYRERMAPGSYLALSHVTADQLPSEMDAVVDLYRNSQNPATLRSREQVQELLTDFETVDPGIVFLPEWRPDRPADEGDQPERSVGYAAVARVE